MLKRLNCRGDTIVEVLIAITIISAVLGGAYVSANQSLSTSRQSQERGEALKLVEGQVERLKSHGASDTSPVYSGPLQFCIDDSNNYQAGTCSGPSSGVDYTLYIDRDSSNSRLFTATAEWDKVGGGSTEQLRIIYKMYPTQ